METRTCVVCGAIAHPRDPRCVDCIKRAALEWTTEHHARNIAALAAIEAKEAAPGPDNQKPIKSPSNADELTVDDVLSIFPELGCGQWEEASPFVGDGKVRLVHPIGTHDGTWLLHDDRDGVTLAKGTLREVLTEAKRRGLLG